VLPTDIVGSVNLIERDEVGIISHWLDFVDHVAQHPAGAGGRRQSLGDGAARLRRRAVGYFGGPCIQHERSGPMPIGGRPPDHARAWVSDVIVGASDVFGARQSRPGS
jgi:hypothetical protein